MLVEKWLRAMVFELGMILGLLMIWYTIWLWKG